MRSWMEVPMDNGEFIVSSLLKASVANLRNGTPELTDDDVMKGYEMAIRDFAAERVYNNLESLLEKSRYAEIEKMKEEAERIINEH